MQIKYPVNKGNGKITTERGDFVRSKSERYWQISYSSEISRTLMSAPYISEILDI